MLMFALTISCLITFNLPLFMDVTFQVLNAILLFPASDFTSITSHNHNWTLFSLWLLLFIISGVISPLFLSSILGTYQSREFVFQCHIIFFISHASNLAIKVMFNISKQGFNSMWTENFQMFKLDLEKAEEPEIKLPMSVGSPKNQESSIKKIYFCFFDYTEAFDCLDDITL